MAFTEITGTEAIGATEWSCVTDTAGPDAATTVGVFKLVLDVTDMVAGDTLQIRVYEKARSADPQSVLKEYILTGAQADDSWASDSEHLRNGWDFTLKAIAGTITVNWSIRGIE